MIQQAAKIVRKPKAGRGRRETVLVQLEEIEQKFIALL
jgi:hypothetical protein